MRRGRDLPTEGVTRVVENRSRATCPRIDRIPKGIAAALNEPPGPAA